MAFLPLWLFLPLFKSGKKAKVVKKAIFLFRPYKLWLFLPLGFFLPFFVAFFTGKEKGPTLVWLKRRF